MGAGVRRSLFPHSGEETKSTFLRLVKFEIHVNREMSLRYQSRNAKLTIPYMSSVFKGTLWTGDNKFVSY